MSTTIFGKPAIFFQCRTMNVPLHTGDEFGILLRQKNATISVRETNQTKKSMSTTAQTYWQSSAEIWECQRNYSLKNEVDKDAISCFSIRKDWRFAVRAKSFALHWRSRGFFRGHVRSCEKGLWGLFIKMATDWEVSEVGDTCRPAAGPGRGQSVQIEWISAGTAHLGFPALWSVPHLLSREIKMNRPHCFFFHQ